MRASIASSSLSKHAARRFQSLRVDLARNISVGSQLMESESVVTLQKARPWYPNDGEGSNLAADNTMSMKGLFEGKTVAVFGVPAPFTGTCTNVHYPPYKALAKEFQAAGVDEIICYSVSDPYAHHGWGVSLENDFKDISFLADTDASFAKHFGVENLYDAVSLGQRSIRFSMLVEDGVVKAFHEVDDASKDAEALLEAVKSAK